MSTLVAGPVGSPAREQDLLFYFDPWEGIDWGLSNGAQVWVGTVEQVGRTTPNASPVVLLFPDGRSLFVGGCTGRRLDDAVRAALGEESDSTVAAVVRRPGSTGRDLVAAMGVLDVEVSPTARPGEAILNPSDYPVAELEQMVTATVTYRVSGGQPTHSVCSKNDSGWNDCVQSVDDVTTVGAYLDGPDLEVWLIDDTRFGPVPTRDGLQGTIAIPPELSGRTLEIDLTIPVAEVLAGTRTVEPGEPGVLTVLNLRARD